MQSRQKEYKEAVRIEQSNIEHLVKNDVNTVTQEVTNAVLTTLNENKSTILQNNLNVVHAPSNPLLQNVIMNNLHKTILDSGALKSRNETVFMHKVNQIYDQRLTLPNLQESNQGQSVKHLVENYFNQVVPMTAITKDSNLSYRQDAVSDMHLQNNTIANPSVLVYPADNLAQTNNNGQPDKPSSTTTTEIDEVRLREVITTIVKESNQTVKLPLNMPQETPSKSSREMMESNILENSQKIDISRISDQVYAMVERRLKTQRSRKGMI